MSLRYNQKTLPSGSKKISDTFREPGISPPQTVDEALVPWTRPSDWLTMPTVLSTDEKYVALVAIFEDSENPLAFYAQGNYNVDWGDGTSENVTSATVASHLYSYAAISGATLSTRGYKQVLVTITPQAGQTLQRVDSRRTVTGYSTSTTVPILELAISLPNGDTTSLALGSTSLSYMHGMLEYVNLINIIGMNGYSQLFSQCYSLARVDFGICKSTVSSAQYMFYQATSLQELNNFPSNTVFSSTLTGMFQGCTSLTNAPALTTSSTMTDTQSMFSGCTALLTVPWFNTESVTSMTSMFNVCARLEEVPLYNTANVTNMSSLLSGCIRLRAVPLFNTSKVINMNSMFLSCRSLSGVPLFKTNNVTDMSSMFSNCSALTSIPLLDTAKVTNMSTMFSNCSSLEEVPYFNTALCTSMVSTFNTCMSLTTVPLFNTASVTNMQSTFGSCSSLKSVPLFNTASVTNMAGMFSSCTALRTVPLFNTANVTLMNNMFSTCSSLQSVPLFDTIKVTNMSIMFNGCASLQSVPLFNTAVCTNMSNMFSSCYSLKSVPLFNTVSCTLMNNMFSSCYSLKSVPLFNTASVTNMQSMFNTCYSLATTEAMNVSAVTTGAFASMFVNCQGHIQGALSGTKFTISYASNNLYKTELEYVFELLGTGTSQTITITGNVGAVTPTSLTSSIQADLLTINLPSTTGLAVGMQVTGTNTILTTGRAVTFTDAGDLVNLTAHGLSNGDEVAFSAITSTTGIVINTIYYIVNANTDDFQVALTAGGAAISLTTNGSGTVRYNSTIVSIIPNTSVTMSRKMSGTTSSATLVYRALQTYRAILKGWTVTG